MNQPECVDEKTTAHRKGPEHVLPNDTGELATKLAQVLDMWQDAVSASPAKTATASNRGAGKSKGRKGASQDGKARAKTARAAGSDRAAVVPGSSAVARRRWDLAGAVAGVPEDVVLSRVGNPPADEPWCQPGDDAPIDGAFVSVAPIATPPPLPPAAASPTSSSRPKPVAPSRQSSSRRTRSPRPSISLAAARAASSSGGEWPPAAVLTVKERMLQLQELLHAGMVSQDEYDAKRRAILAAL